MTTTDMQQPDHRRYQPSQRMELTLEEAKAWNECIRNSSVIAPTLFSAAIGYGIFWVSPFRAQAKIAAVVGGVLGLISGRVAISELCLAKVASMPNSNLKDRLIEAGHYGMYKPSERRDAASAIPSTEETSTEIVFDDYPAMSSYDTYSSLSDSSDVQTSEDTDLTEPINMQKSVSYDELRHRNRDEFYRKNKQWYTAQRMPERSAPTSGTDNQQIPPQTTVPPTQEKTKYGDIWG